MGNKQERFDRHVRREPVNWKETASHGVLIILVFTTGFLSSVEIYPPAFGIPLLVVLVMLWIYVASYWRRKRALNKKEKNK